MKKIRLVALGLGALSIAGLVGAGVGLSVNNNVMADEVKADNLTFYLEGTLGEQAKWNTSDSIRCFSLDDDGNFGLTFYLSQGSTFKIYSGSWSWRGYKSTLPSVFTATNGDGSDIYVNKTGVYKITIPVDPTNNSNWIYDDWNIEDVTDSYCAHVWATSTSANWNQDSAKAKIGIWNPSSLVGAYQIVRPDYVSGNYYRYTVPASTSGFKFVRCSSDYSTSYDNETAQTNTPVFNSVYTIAGVWNNFTMTSGAAEDNSVSSEMFGKALDLINTCSPNTVSGYEAYDNLNTNFYSKLQTTADLNYTINDFSYSDYVSNSKDYNEMVDSGAVRATSVKIQDKWDLIKTNYQNAHKSPVRIVTENTDNSAVVAGATIAASTSVIASGAFLLIRRRKLI